MQLTPLELEPDALDVLDVLDAGLPDTLELDVVVLPLLELESALGFVPPEPPVAATYGAASGQP